MAERTMLDTYAYADEFRQQQDQYVDNDTTVGTGVQFGNTLVDQLNALAGRQGLVDNSDMFALGLLGRAGKAASNTPVGRSMFSPKTMLRSNPGRLPVDAPIDTTWSRELAGRYGEQFAKDYWIKQEAAKRGKLYTSDTLNDFFIPSTLERAIGTTQNVLENPVVSSSLTSGNILAGYGDRLLGNSNE
jgi:hypothetical protein